MSFGDDDADVDDDSSERKVLLAVVLSSLTTKVKVKGSNPSVVEEATGPIQMRMACMQYTGQ